MKPDNMILEGVAGSQSHGLAREDSDKDLFGVFIVPTEQLVGIYKSPAESIQEHEPQDASWHEVGKFLKLAIGGNPSILEFMWLDTYTDATDDGIELLGLREAVLSRELVRDRHFGYAKAQLEKFTNRVSKPKHARHVLRLLRQGKNLYETGEMKVRVDDPQFYFDLETWEYNKVHELLVQELESFPKPNDPSPLPDAPDLGKVNDYLLKMRKKHWTDQPLR